MGEGNVNLEVMEKVLMSWKKIELTCKAEKASKQCESCEEGGKVLKLF
jgi:hypothetical protein